MLLEFSVQNFKSIAARQKISMVAGKGSAQDDARSFTTGNSFASHALRSACIMGPNGSGKSSLVNALDFFATFVGSSAKNATDGERINVTPFKLKKEFRDQPSEFEAIFIAGDALYQYGFAVDRERVFAEWLFSRPNESGTRMRMLFQRVYSSTKKEYLWEINESKVKGERETWKNSTRANALFLSTAVQLNSKSLREPFHWIRNFLKVIDSPERLSHTYSATTCMEDVNRQRVIDFVRSADLRIEDLVLEEKEVEIPKQLEEFMSENALKTLRESNAVRKNINVSTVHIAEDGERVLLDLDDESDGTQVIFALAGPWINVLNNGYTLVVDELHNSLHPYALKHLVSMFHDPDINRNGAQLIFTTHDVSIISKDVMHLDQIWFMDKENNGESHLYPLSDFDVRNSDAFQKGYLDGRYGALPHLKDFDIGIE